MSEPISLPKKKKLPFKPTALRRTAVTTGPTISASSSTHDLRNTQESDDGGANDLAIFRRGQEMAPRLASDLERRLKKKQEQKLKAESERRRSSSGWKRPHDDQSDEETRDTAIGDDAFVSPIADAEHSTGPSVGRPRSSDQASVDPVTPPSKRSRNANQDFSSGHHHHSSPIAILPEHDAPSQTSSSTRSTRSRPQARPPPEVDAIVLSDSDTELPSHAVKPPSRHAPPPPREPSIEIVDPVDEDDEFSEYVLRAAAARASLKAQNQPSTSNQTSASNTTSSSPPQHAEVLVTSSLPDSIPCKALMRFDQSLRLLRDSWAAKQRKAGLDVPESTAILTWRRARVYNTSTLLHLGLKPGENGRIKLSESSTARGGLSRSYSSATNDGLSDDGTYVQLEAWTQATFAEMEREEALRKQPQPSSPLHNSHSFQEEEEEEEEIKLRVILRARDLKDVRLTVRPATTAETLINGFRAQIAITNPEVLSSNPMITLWFDGDQLQEHDTLEDADIADKDIIEVHLRAS